MHINKMNRRPKHGISKPKHAQENKKIKKSLRYFACEEPDETEKKFPVTGSQMCSSKKKKVTFHGDRTKQLLEMTSRTVRFTDVGSGKYAPLNSFSETDVLPDTKRDSVLPGERQLPSKAKDKKSTTKTTKENLEWMLNGKGSGPGKHKPKSNEQKNSEHDGRKSSAILGNSSQQKIQSDVSKETFNKSSPKCKKRVKEQAITGKTNIKSKASKKSILSQMTTTGELGTVNNTTQEKIMKEVKGDNISSKSGAVGKSKPQTLNKKCTPFRTQDLSHEQNSEDITTRDVKISHTNEVKTIKRALNHVSLETDHRSTKDKNKKKKLKKKCEKESPADEESNEVPHCEDADHSPMKCQQNLASTNGEQTVQKNLKTINGSHSENFEENIAELREENCLGNENKMYSDVLEDSTSLTDSYLKDHKKNRKKKFKTKKELTNSSPIFVEMSRNCSIPSNPFRGLTSGVKTQNVKSKIKTSDLELRPTLNAISNQKWEVQFVNSDDCTDIVQMKDLMLEESLTTSTNGQSELPFISGSTETNLEYNENEILDHETMDISGDDSTTLLSQSPEDSTSHSVVRNKSDAYQLFNVSRNEMILVLSPSGSLFFKGALKVKVIVGKIYVLGCELNSTAAESYTVYSPNGMSFLGFQACTESDTFSSEAEYWKLVRKRLVKTLQAKILHKVPAFSTLVLLGTATDTLIPFLDKFFPSVHFPTTMSKKASDPASAILKVEFAKSRTCKEKSEWRHLVKCLLKHDPGKMRVMTCGGKGVGKSTLLRFLTNQMLSTFEEVLYIDLDPGQCEFTTPGCISAVVVKNPLLGPNFTHCTPPERMVYIGEVNVSRCSVYYLECVQHILDWCCSQPHLTQIPWFINTMGFTKALGLELTVSIIRMITLSDLIEIRSIQYKRNFPTLLKPENVQNHVTSLLVPEKISDLDYSFHEIPSAAENQYHSSAPWGTPANILRETALLSYFGHLVAPPAFSFLEVVPHLLPFSGLKLCVSHEKLKFSSYLAAMNANLVALCDASNINGLKPSDPTYPEILEKAPICNCLGFGIVRCIDLEKKAFFIISPIEPKMFALVNCLILGAIHLPDNVFTLQEEALGTIPYVIQGERVPLSRGVRAAKSVSKKKAD